METYIFLPPLLFILLALNKITFLDSEEWWIRIRFLAMYSLIVTKDQLAENNL